MDKRQASIRVIEDRVKRVVERVHQLSTERARLEREIGELKAKLADAHSRPARVVREPARKEWLVSPAEVATTLRDTIQELREA